MNSHHQGTLLDESYYYLILLDGIASLPYLTLLDAITSSLHGIASPLDAITLLLDALASLLLDGSHGKEGRV